MKKKLLPLLFILSMFSAFGQNIMLTTTSNSSVWSPVTVANSGATLKWTASGGGIVEQIVYANDPTFNLSANTGTVTITVESADGFDGLSRLSLNYLKVSNLNLSAATKLELLSLRGNVNLGTVALSNFPLLSTFYADGTDLTSIDFSENKLLKTIWIHNNDLPYVQLDKVIMDLDMNGVINGTLKILGQSTRSTLTYNSLNAYNNLKSKNWNIDAGPPPPLNLKFVTFSTTSILADWTPVLSDNWGVTLKWTATGGGIPEQVIVADKPTFDFSANTGTVNITIESTDGFAGFWRFWLNYLDVSNMDLSNATAMERLNLRSNANLGTIDLSPFPNLDRFGADETDLYAIDVSNKPELNHIFLTNNDLSVEQLDQVMVDLDANGTPNGFLNIGNQSTGALLSLASIEPFNNLKTKGWKFDLPEINVLGQGISIPGDGTNVPKIEDDTDFGTTGTGNTIKKTFVIQNLGDKDPEGSAIYLGPADLVLTNPSPFIVITGADAADFDITAIPTSPILAQSSTTFEITFLANTAGVKNATVIIRNNDFDEIDFSFKIRAETAGQDPEISITGNDVSIAGDGTNTPMISDDTDFGTTDLTGSITKTYTIQNSGNTDLLLSGNPVVQVSGVDATDFTVNMLPQSPIPAGGSTTFSITFDASTSGVKTAVVGIENSDGDEPNYTFNIKGEINIVSIGPKMLISGNDLEILHGTTSTNMDDGTDFGEVIINGNATQTFFMKNIGDAPLIVYPNTTLGNPFTIAIQPSSPISPGDSTSVKITYSPTMVGTQNAQVAFYSNDLTNPLFPGSPNGVYNFFISGEGVYPPPVQDIMITQYYEGSTESKWIEVVNRSIATIPAGKYYLALYDQGEIPFIQTQAPSRFEEIPELTPGQVVLFSNFGATFPVPGNIGIPMVDVIESTACDFDGYDIILISTSVNTNCYANRVDMMGNLSGNQWGVDTSFIRGGFSSELPERDFNINSWTSLSIEGEVNTADTGTNIALGTQIIGPSRWDGTQWTGLKPDRTRNVEINGPYNANYGSIVACNLTVNDVLDFDESTTNYVIISNNLFINNTFTLGDEESLLTLNPQAIIDGEIIKNEKSTPLNNIHDVTYWSSPVENETIGQVFDGVDPNRIFYLNPAAVNPAYAGTIYGHWFIADGNMTPGRGYSAEGISTGVQLVSFKGKPNNGDLTLTVNYKGSPDTDAENDNFNLVGNPYPSALAIDPLLLDSQNGNLEKTIYLWSHNTPVSGGGDFVGADYATYTAVTGGVAAVSGGAIPNGYLASGQGFMVRTERTGNGLINFENDDRVVDSIPVFFKSENKKKEVIIEKNRLWISLKTNQGGFKQILLGFMEGAADYKDSFDGLQLKSNNPISLYSVIGNEKFAIQGFGPFSTEKEVVLGFDTDVAPRTFTVGIDQKEGIFKDQEVYLTDNLLGITHNLSQSAYSFEQTISGEFTNRFTLQFAKNSLDVEEIIQGSEFNVFNSAEGFRINASKVVKEVKVYDMLGRMIMSSKPDQQSFYMNANNLKTGAVLIFEVKLENGTILNKKAIKM